MQLVASPDTPEGEKLFDTITKPREIIKTSPFW
jgi:hypothetical protein